MRAAGFAEWRKSLAQPAAARERRGRAPAGAPARRSHRDAHAQRAATRQRSRQASASSASEDIQRRPALVPDDLLRQLPEFSLFRRSSSVSAHPTSQGVSLRGIGPSGVSRSLVLLDGVPFNDAFGGWVYWTALPMESAERIEVVNGASSSLYGSYAMGGVLNVVTRPPERRTFGVKTQYGSRAQPEGGFSRAATSGARSACRSTAASSTPTGMRNVLAVAAGPGGHESGRAVRPRDGQGRLQPERSRAGLRANRLLPRGAAQREDHDASVRRPRR